MRIKESTARNEDNSITGASVRWTCTARDKTGFTIVLNRITSAPRVEVVGRPVYPRATLYGIVLGVIALAPWLAFLWNDWPRIQSARGLYDSMRFALFTMLLVVGIWFIIVVGRSFAVMGKILAGLAFGLAVPTVFGWPFFAGGLIGWLIANQLENEDGKRDIRPMLERAIGLAKDTPLVTPRATAYSPAPGPQMAPPFFPYPQPFQVPGPPTAPPQFSLLAGPCPRCGHPIASGAPACGACGQPIIWPRLPR